MSTDDERQQRIENEIIVDAYGEEEVKMGWYTYMQDELRFPFTAFTMIKKRSGAFVKQKIDVLGLDDSDDNYFGSDIMLEASYVDDIFLVPMLKLIEIEAEEETIKAIGDWKYWKKKHPYA